MHDVRLQKHIQKASKPCSSAPTSSMHLYIRLCGNLASLIRVLRREVERTALGSILANLWRIVARATSHYKFFWPLSLLQKPALHARYTSKDAEQAYWRAVERATKRLQASNANNPPDGLLVYYAPKLLPGYRDAKIEDPEAKEEYISPKTFCKWHRMVFPGHVGHSPTLRVAYPALTERHKRQPTLKEAERAVKVYSSRDRREMKRITRLQHDHEIFQRLDTSPDYGARWRTWLATKGPDIAIVFAADA